jgi:iron-sulfur cluster repair protein YtfE (RIC family)
MLKKPIDLIDQIISEHKQIIDLSIASKSMANDIAVISQLDESIKSIAPKGSNARGESLRNLLTSLEKINQMLEGHFSQEEGLLLNAFQKQRQSTIASTFSFLVDEHQELKKHIARSRQLAAELAAKGLSREVWKRKAKVMQIYLHHTLKLLEAHAETETQLLQELRQELKRA